MLKKFIFLLTAIITLSLVVIAQDDKATTLTGYITDTDCATGKMHKASDPQAAAAGHEKSCVLGCSKNGLGVYSDGKYTPFDAKGSELAKAALEKSKKDKGAKFKITGKVTDGKLTVKDITEVE